MPPEQTPTQSRRAVWKYTLDPWGSVVSMPKESRLLHVHEQGDAVCLWVEVDPHADRVDRKLLVVGTGHPAPLGDATYVGTAHLVECGAPIVIHVYDGGEIDG